MKNARIIQVTSYYPPHLGGMENCVFEISKTLSANGREVEVLTSDVGYKSNYKASREFSVEYLPSIEVAHTPIIFSLFAKLISIPKNSIIHLHISQAFTPEIVYLVSKIRNIPFIAHVHLDVDASGVFGFLLAPYKRIFLSTVLHNATRIICLSESQKKEIAQKYNLSLLKIDVVPNGVGNEYFISRSKDKGLNQTPRLLFVGRLSPQKNVSEIIEAVSLMKEKVVFDIVGSGEENVKIKNLITAKKLKNVRMLGAKKGQDLLNHYKNADVFVMASHREGVSLALLEAMAAGLPIVAVKAPGVKELIGDCGIVTSDRSVGSLSLALDSIVSSSKLRNVLSVKASKKASEFTWDKTVSKIEKIYNKIQNVN